MKFYAKTFSDLQLRAADDLFDDFEILWTSCMFWFGQMFKDIGVKFMFDGFKRSIRYLKMFANACPKSSSSSANVLAPQCTTGASEDIYDRGQHQFRNTILSTEKVFNSVIINEGYFRIRIRNKFGDYFLKLIFYYNWVWSRIWLGDIRVYW